MSGDYIDFGKVYFPFRLFDFSNQKDITCPRVYTDFIKIKHVWFNMSRMSAVNKWDIDLNN